MKRLVPPLERQRETSARQWIRLSAQALVTVTIGVWIVFEVLDTLGQGARGVTAFVKFTLPMVVLGVMTWTWPRAAGLLLMAAGGFVAWYFHHPAPRLFLALPFAVLGLTLLIVGGHTIIPRRWEYSNEYLGRQPPRR
jgi:hypothetical protein